MNVEEITLETSRGDVNALLQRPAAARWLLVVGHGAGAGMRHRFMETVAARFAARDLATLWALDDAVVDKARAEAVTALRSLDAPFEPRLRRIHYPLLVFERA